MGSRHGLLTQNTRGFRDTSRSHWMAAWKKRVTGTNVHFILIQETHIGSIQEAVDLQEQWARAWGRQHDPDKPLSFWSIADTASRGVAILLRPDLQESFSKLQWGGDPGRAIAIASASRAIVNVYAPTHRSKREAFFAELDGWLEQVSGPIYLAGDFNCVLNPRVDRISLTPRTEKPESPALEQLVRKHGLRDALELNPAAQDDAEMQLTYHQTSANGGARLDRCYVSPTWFDWVVNTQVVIPQVPSDHLGFLTWLRDPGIRTIDRPLQPLLFPIHGRDQGDIDQQIGDSLQQILSLGRRTSRPWDDTLQHISDALRLIKRTERRRAKRSIKRWERKLRRRITTRAEWIAYEQARHSRQMQRRRGERLAHTSGTEHEVFARLAQRTSRMVVNLDGEPELSIPDKFARAWTPLLTERHAQGPVQDIDHDLKALCTIPDDHVLTERDNADLLAPITSEEVEDMIKGLGAHKASGADRLNNDFYRAWPKLLAPALTDEFNRILRGGAMPTSFTEAIIVPLPKTGQSSNPMEYRPISLLQSSYKIFTKLLAHRLQSSLGRVINADQNGFVRGRDMANNIFLMQAILAQQYETDDDTADEAPIVVLLDFKKAYDTLDRSFLQAALRAFGYSPKFVALVDQLHTNTTARFLANGGLSASIQVRTGIRQGCPLAPLLFLIAAETLKYAIVQTPDFAGIQMTSAGRSYRHGFSAFVDDSVVFAEKGSMLTAVDETLRRFGEISGLQVQPTKSHAIVLNRRCQTTHVGTFPVVAVGDTVTYLGVEIGLQEAEAANWDKRLEKLNRSLRAASRYTTSLTDRVDVLNSIGLSAILFTAKYASPTPETLRAIEAIWRQYLWNGTTSADAVRAHKLAIPILALPRAELGLGLRDIREALADQAARTILHWNTRHHDKYWAAFHLLLREEVQSADEILHNYPSWKAHTTNGLVTGKVHLFQVGWTRVNAGLVGRYPPPEAVNQLKQQAAERGPTDSRGLWWRSSREGKYTLPQDDELDWDHVATVAYAAMPHEIRSYWDTFPWYDNAWIVSDTGAPLATTDFPLIGISKLGELKLRRDGDCSFTFVNPCKRDPFRMTKTQQRQLVQWLHIVIVNTGFLRADPAPEPAARVYSLNAHPVFDQYEWHVQSQDEDTTLELSGRLLTEKWFPAAPTSTGRSSIRAKVTAWGAPVDFIEAIGGSETQAHLQTLQERTAGAVILAGHPALHHGPTLLTPTANYQQARRKTETRFGLQYTLCVRRRRETALRLLLDRLHRSQARDPSLQAALRDRPIRIIQERADGETAYQAIFRYRLIMGALNLRDQSGARLGCPHDWCPCPADDMSLTHVLWECGAAQCTWQLVHRQWTRRQLVLERHESLRFSLGSGIPVLARAIRAVLRTTNENHAIIDAVQHTAWRMIQAIVPQQLWLHRNATAFRDDRPSVHGIAATTWATVKHQVEALAAAKRADSTTYEFGHALGTLWGELDTDANAHGGTSKQVRLYYDGGARGNPGVAGSGSILLERATTTDDWQVVWWAARYLGEHGTNNVAEHTALAAGLKEAAQRYGTTTDTIIIIGDSMLATRQLLLQYRATCTRISTVIKTARAALHQLFNFEFRHTLRSGNTAADWLANKAMDERRSTTSTACSITDFAAAMSTLALKITSDTEHTSSTMTAPLDAMTTILNAATRHGHHEAPSRKRPRPIALTTKHTQRPKANPAAIR